MKTKKLIATSLIANFLGLNISLAAEKPLPPLPGAKVNVQNTYPEIVKEKTTTKEIQGPIVKPESRYLKAGHDLTVELLNNIDSYSAKPGDIIAARLLLPVDLNGKIVIPEGSIITGDIKKLQKATSSGKDAQIMVRFNYIELANGEKIHISGKIKTKDESGILTGGKYKDQLQKSIVMGATTTAGGTLAGLGIGLLASAATVGSIVGLIVGGALGFGWLFFKKGKSIKIPKSTKLLVNLEYDVAITNIGL